MKEEGIRKLKNILNEYEYFKELKEVPEEEKDLFVQKFFWCESYGVLNSYGCEDYEILKRKFCYMYAISKEYGFIKWLVDNDKIDRDKFKEKNGTHGMRKLNKRFNVIGEGMIDGEDYSDLESILMILSIQDNPIEFLISILK